MDQVFNDDTSNNISNIKFTSVTIKPHNCNVNRSEEELILLNDFNDAFPYYDEENGLYIRATSKVTGKSVIVPLDMGVSCSLLINKANEMNEYEYHEEFVKRKTEYLRDHLIRNTFAKGYEVPSAVQSIACTELIKGKDALVQFKAGTGKTHAFLFGCLWAFDQYNRSLQNVFITSSHEVAMQIFQQAKDLIGAIAKIALCIGQKTAQQQGGFKSAIGTSSLNARPLSFREEMAEITNAQILVCTMGKFYDLFCNKKKIDATYLKAICVDEFDNIIASNKSQSRHSSSCMMSTEEQMAIIIEKIPKKAQRVFFSATVSPDAFGIAHSYFRNSKSHYDPLIVLLDADDYTLDDIRQYYVESTNLSDKKAILIDLIKQCRISQAIVFANSINTAKEIKYLFDDQTVPIQSSVFHGNLSDVERRKITQDFRGGNIRILISTDVTARGFDVQSVNVVFNFDMPDSLDTYIHRVGRSGRYNRKGVAISLITTTEPNNEFDKVKEINAHSKIKMAELPEDLSSLL